MSNLNVSTNEAEGRNTKSLIIFFFKKEADKKLQVSITKVNLPLSKLPKTIYILLCERSYKYLCGV